MRNSSCVRFLAGLALLTIPACGARSTVDDGGPEAAAAAADRPSPVLLLSIDGFRPDYLERGLTPNLNGLAERGARAEALIPSFPTKTFPNHYSIVTGLRPDRHGLVANNMWDPERRESYSLSDREAVADPAWYGGTPVWVTAERRGMATAPLFWPGSEAPIQGVRPTHWKAYNGDMPHGERVDWVVARLAGDVGPPVGFATLYFDDVDAAGHDHGPAAAATDTAIARVDSTLGYLIDRLGERIPGGAGAVNLVVVSDHGMSPTAPDRVIFLDDYIDPESTMIADWNPVAAIWTDSSSVDSLYAALADRHPHLDVYRRSEIPERYGFGSHVRVAPIVAIADPRWTITTRERFARDPDWTEGGNHGYDQQARDMRALFVAAGPDIRRGVTVPAFPNVDVYEILMSLLDLPPAPGDGRLERAAGVLRGTTAHKNGGGS